jgi:solute carrier family 25 protein 33/36
MSDDPAQNIPAVSDLLPQGPEPALKKVGGVILPSKTWVPFLAGAIGGMAGACLTAPLDVVKTRLQSDFYRDRIQAAKLAGTVTSKLGVWRHFMETGVILR